MILLPYLQLKRLAEVTAGIDLLCRGGKGPKIKVTGENFIAIR